MKKKLLPLLALGVIACSFSVAGINNGLARTEASVTPHVLINDDFNDSKYKGTINTNIWTSETTNPDGIHQSLNSDCYLDNNTGKGNCESCALVTNRVINGIQSFQFDMKYDSKAQTSNKWMSVYFANEYQDMFTTLAYNGLMRVGYNAIFKTDYVSFDKENFNFAVCLGTGVSLVSDWLTIKITIDSSTSGSINACVQGGTFVDANKVSFTYNQGIDLQNCLVGLSVSNEAGEVKIDNLSLINGGEPLNEDFSHCDPTDPTSDYIYQVREEYGGDLSLCTFTVVDNCTLDLDSAEVNDYIFSNKEVEDPASSVEEIDILDLTFKPQINKANYKIGIVFGYDFLTADIFKKTVVYEIGKSQGRLYEYNENGDQILPEEGNKNYFDNIKDAPTIEIKINKKTGLSVTEAGKSVQYGGKAVKFSSVSHYYGSVAIVLLSKGTASPAICSIDQFKLTTNTYYVPVTKSVTHNFSNDYWGNESKPDFYVRDSQGAGKQTVKDGKLVWNMASDGTFFGSAHQYDSFILDFKLMSIYGDNSVDWSTDITAKNRWIGLDLSRDVLTRSTYSSYVSLLTVITPQEDWTEAPVWVNCDKFSSVKADDIERKTFNRIPQNYFKDITYADEASKGNIKPEDAICFRYVSEGGNLTMYLKKASEVTFTKITTLYNLELKGYFALCCTGYTYLEIDDFSMANTSPVFECADNDVPETIIKTVTEIIYDNQNNPIHLDEEIRLNTQYKTYLTLVIVFGVTTVLAAGGIVTIVIINKKKGHKQNHEETH